MRPPQGPQPHPLTPAPDTFPTPSWSLANATSCPGPRGAQPWLVLGWRPAWLSGCEFHRSCSQPHGGGGSATSLFVLHQRVPQATEATEAEVGSTPDAPSMGRPPCPGWPIRWLLRAQASWLFGRGWTRPAEHPWAHGSSHKPSGPSLPGPPLSPSLTSCLCQNRHLSILRFVRTSVR